MQKLLRIIEGIKKLRSELVGGFSGLVGFRFRSQTSKKSSSFQKFESLGLLMEFVQRYTSSSL